MPTGFVIDDRQGREMFVAQPFIDRFLSEDRIVQCAGCSLATQKYVFHPAGTATWAELEREVNIH